MPRHQGVVLVDTNVIIESWRVSCWRALTSGYAVESVEMCAIIETQTGLQRRRPEERIDLAEIQATLRNIHGVGTVERAEALLRDDQIRFLDAGEQMLWAHALTRSDAWLLCGPDKASLRVGIRLGLRDRLVSLERLLLDVGHRPKQPLKRQYTEQWLRDALSQIASLEEPRR
ncbi:hypothetical protein ELG65_15835 [Rhizobium leguminosarum]|uniref:hypothetical protein n=1 Tax=Rhizobium leguminosarum TaxID=384 RepID=UPI0010318D32|nr:hypothetical protein [Rhizobium leguminosarum]TBH59770.1 hypothetical protein ELG65_15835 [Rhizobium leguminosarum]